MAIMQTLTLKQARIEFSLAIAELILYAHSIQCDLALAEGMDRRTAKDPTSDHMTGSLHDMGLAQDVDLYKDGVYLMNTEDHAPLGAWWKQYGIDHGLPLAWGGDFTKKDGNHYSLSWGGKS
jgi:hypothetical protein